MEKTPQLLPGRKHAPASLGRMLVLGLGKSGEAACRYCEGLLGGRVEDITVAGGDSSAGSLAFADGHGSPQARFYFDSTEVEGRFDLCIASPGISQFDDFYLNAQKASTEVISEVEFAWRESAQDALWVAVTGTNGKSTTTALAAHILAASGRKAVAVGNIGDTCLDAVAAGKADIYVAEVSSYQLASTKYFAPNVAVLLNITPDHLAWHKSHEAYVAAKTKVFDNLACNPGAVAVLDATDAEARRIVRGFKARPREERGFDYIPLGAAAGLDVNMQEACGSENGAYLRDGRLCLSFKGRDLCFGPVDGLQIKGRHNAANALAAATAAAVLGVPEAAIADALKSFAPLEHRIEPCGAIAGVACYNDSKATNVDATLQALCAFGDTRPIVLLGGYDKGTGLEGLVRGAEEHCKAVVCFGAAGPRFLDAFKGAQVPSFPAAGLEDALDVALEHAQAGDVVILSPACSSFDEFDDFEHRGTVFKDLVARRTRERGA